MQITTQPGDTLQGDPLAGPPAVTLYDGSDNPVEGVDVTVSVNKNSLNGTLTRTTNTQGRAVFDDLTIDVYDSGYSLTFEADDGAAPAVSNVTSNSFQIFEEQATLTISNQPAEAVVERPVEGTNVVEGPVVTVEDMSGSPLSGVNITARLSGGDFADSSTVTVASDDSGRAVFDSLFISTPATGYQVVFATGTQTVAGVTSNAFDVVAASGKITFDRQPRESIEGYPVDGPPAIYLEDGGSPLSGVDVTAYLDKQGFTTDSQQTVTTDGTGKAVFDNLVIDTALNGYRLHIQASRSGVATVASDTFDVVEELAVLSVQQQPTLTIEGETLNGPPSVRLTDKETGNPPTSPVNVYAYVNKNDFTPSSDTLAAATSANNGVATFDSLIIDEPDTGYEIRFSTNSSGIADVTTPSFEVTPRAGNINITTPPGESIEGYPLSGPPSVTLLDTSGNPLQGVSVGVILNKNGFASGTTTQTTDAGGQATFDDLVIDQVAGDYRVTFDVPLSSGVDDTTSASFDVVEETAILTVQNQPSLSIAGETVNGSPSVLLEDAATGDPVTNATVSVSLSKGSITGGTTTVTTDGSGVAVFEDLVINSDDSGYELVFSTGTPGIADVSSDPFDVIPVAGQISITRQPGETVDGYPVEGPPSIEVTETDGVTPKSGLDVTATLNKNGFTGGSTQTVTTDAGGVAVFDQLIADQTADNYAITFNMDVAEGIPSATTDSFDVVGEVAVISIHRQPQTSLAGEPLEGPPEVKLETPGGDPINGGTLYAGVNKSGFSGSSITSATTNSNGIAVFDQLVLDNADTGYELTFSSNSSGIAPQTTNSFEVTAPEGVMNITRQPQETVDGEFVAGPPEITLTEPNGDPWEGSEVDITVSVNKNGFSSGRLTRTTTNGVVAFDSLVMSAPDTAYELTFSTDISNRIASNTTNKFDVEEVTGFLNVTLQPSETVAGDPINGPPTVRLTNKSGDPVPDVTINASLNKGSFSGSSTLSAITNDNGEAVFDNLVVDDFDTGYQINFSTGASGVADVVSDAFEVTDATLSMNVTTQPQSTTAGDTIGGHPAVTVTNSGGGVSGVVVTASLNQNGFAGASTLTATTGAGGVAVFDELVVNKTATGYRITFNANHSGVPNAESNAFEITHAPADHLEMSQQPATTQAGSVINGPPAVVLYDAFGNPVTGEAIEVVPNQHSFHSGTATQVTGSDGKAVFGDLVITQAASNYQLLFTDTTGANVSSSGFAITNGPADQISIVTQPSETVAGAAISGPPAVAVSDPYGNPVEGETVAISEESGYTIDGGTLSRETRSNGQAVFTDLVINTVDAGYQFRFSVGGTDALSNTFNVVPGTIFSRFHGSSHSGFITHRSDAHPLGQTPVRMEVVKQPGESIVGVAIEGPPEIAVYDATDEPVPNVSVTVSGPSFTGGTTTVTTGEDGHATFGDLVTDTKGTYTLDFAADNYPSVSKQSDHFDVIDALATMTLSNQPQQSTAGETVAGPPTVTLENSIGMPMEDVNISVYVNQHHLVSGNTTVTTDQDGQAVFDDLVINKAAGNYQLIFEADYSGVQNITSQAFRVVAADADAITIASQPRETYQGATIEGPPTAKVSDAYGNPVQGFEVSVSESLSGSIDAGITSLTTGQDGLAAFSTLVIEEKGTYQLAFSGTGLSGATSNTFHVVPGSVANRFKGSSHSGFTKDIKQARLLGQTPIRMEVVTQPMETVAGFPVEGPPEIAVYDATDNPVPNVQVTVQAVGGSFSGGTFTKTTDAQGRIAFNDLVIDTKGSYELSFSADNHTSTVSDIQTATFDVVDQLYMMEVASQPQNSTAGESIQGSPKVTITNFINQPLSGVEVTVYLNQHGFASGTTTLQTDQHGEAVFDDLVINQAAGDYQLIFDADYSGITNVSSNKFDVGHAEASALTIASQPTETTEGAAIQGPPAVALEDAFGNPLPGETVNVAESGGYVFDAGTTSLQTGEDGLATFSDLVINAIGTYSLTFSHPSVSDAVSQDFLVQSGTVSNRFTGSSHSGFNRDQANNKLLGQTPTRMEIVHQPGETVVGQPVEGPPKVVVYDAVDNPVANADVTVSLPGGFKPGSTVELTTNSEGEATFDNLVVESTGSYQLSFAVDGYPGVTATSETFDVIQQQLFLSVTTQPGNTTAGEAVAGHPTVQLANSIGQGYQGVEVTVQLNQHRFDSDPATQTVTTDASGYAEFDQLVINNAAEGYQLLFDADYSGVLNVSSESFDVVPAAADHLAAVTEPKNTESGAAIKGPPAVAAYDAYGNPVSGLNVSAAESGGYAFDGGTTTAATGEDGTATFDELVINTTGEYSLTFSASGVSDLVSGFFRVLSGTVSYRFEGSSHSGFHTVRKDGQLLGQTPTRLEILAQPMETVVGDVIEGPPRVVVYDAVDNPVAGITIRASVNGFFASGSVTEIQTNAQGEAVFDNLAIEEMGTYTLTFEAVGYGEVSPVNSQDFEVVNQALHTTIVQQPTESQAGDPVAGPPAVKLENDFGQGFQGVDIVAHINQNSYSAASTDTVTTDASGVATFNNLVLEKAAGNYQIIFEVDYSGVPNTSTQYFDVTAGTASTMEMVTQPGNGLAEAAISGPPAVVLYDDYGNPISNADVTVSEAGGYTLDAGTLTRSTGSDGRATFDDLVINTPGSYTLNFSTTQGSVPDLQSRTFDLLPGKVADRFRGGSHSGFISDSTRNVLLKQVPKRIVMTTHPARSVVDAPIQGPPSLKVYDQTDVPVEGAAVTATVVGGSPALSGTMTLTTDASGEVVFDDLVMDQTGTYQLHFEVGGYPDVDVISREFEVTEQTLSMSVGQQPQGTEAGQVIGGPPAVALTNEVGQPAPAGIEVVVHTNQYGFSSDPSHDTVQTDASGVAVFDQLTIEQAAEDYQLIFEASYSGVSSVTSNIFTITPAPADHLEVLQEPADGEAGSVIAGPPAVGLFDVYGNPIPGASISVSESGGEPLNGATSMSTGADGSVQFDDLVIDNPGAYQLVFSTSAAGVDDQNSRVFNVISTGTVHRFKGGTHSGFISEVITDQPLQEPPEVEVPTFTVFEDTLCQGAVNTQFTAEAANSDSIRYSVTLSPAGEVIDSTGVLDLETGFYGEFFIKATAYGYQGPKSDSLKIIVEPEIDAPVFSDPVQEVCQGGTSDYTATAVHTDSITYTVSPMEAGNIDEQTGAMIWASDFSGTAQIIATAGEPGDCGGQKQTTVDVTVNPEVGKPVFTQGATGVCQGAPNETYSADADHATDIVYSRSPAEAGIINSTTGEMDWDPDFHGTVTITARAEGNCNGPKDTERTVTVHPKPTPTITGDSAVACEATGKTYSTDLHTGASYSWSVPNGATITSGATGTENNSITVDFGQNNGDVSVVETSQHGCVGEQEQLAVTLYGCDLSANFSSDKTQACEGGTVTFTDNSNGSPDTWKWNFGSGATPETATGMGPHDVTYASQGSYSVRLIVEEKSVKDTMTLTDHITVSRRGLWLGDVSSDWFDPDNWSCGEVPDNSGSLIDVVIQQSATYDPQITSDGARVGEIEIESGASLEIINDATMNVYGSWYNNGSFSGSNSLVVFRGSGVEIAGSSVTPFGDIEIAGTGVTATADSIDVKGDFTADGSFDHNAGIVSFTGNASQQVSGTADSLIFFDMVVDKQADTLHLARHVDVAQYLTLDQGIVASSAGSLMRLMDNAGADQGHDGSYVDGPVEKKGDDPFIFPTGNSGVWAPIEITAPSQESDVFRARYVFEGHPEAGNDPCNNCGDSIKVVKDVEYWDLSRIQGSSSPDVTLHIKDMSRSGISGIGSLTYAHWNGSQWIDRTLQGSAQLDGSGGCTITGTGFSSYNIHAPAEAAVVCPDTGPVYSIPNDFAK